MADLQYSPIQEVVCEFRFSKDTEWKGDLASILYDKLKDDFPEKKQKISHKLELKANVKGIESQKAEPVSNDIFLSEDGKILIQIYPRMISVNCLKPYPSWEIFSQKIDQVYSTLQEIVEIKEIDRIGLLYINKIEIEDKKFELRDYFNFYPHVSPQFPQDVANFIVGCEFVHKNGAELSKLDLGRTFPSKKESNAFLLREEYYTAPNYSVRPEDAIEWIENAHMELKKLFNGCITEKMKESFNEIK
ncbi:TIGR04255 family protein [Methanogenium organophilum]|uniref:TIGR04255 family protein n=1 Tax=Methanogenium organophilum TaxID=2199 RepID=A0A9X9S3T7_METOG|nr:TIGR04255 family protein [Methanogenium organophilum]WAI00395.1 TIGR04255 family protein [Methanogenium organophilum]